MKETSLDTVRRMAQLARLALSEEELSALAPQFARLLEAFEILARFRGPKEALEAAEPSASRARADETQPSLPREAALANAPEIEDGFFAVPKTVGAER